MELQNVKLKHTCPPDCAYSDKDISAGDRWAQKIAGELETSNFGIICITPENLNSEWILFESGALSKSMQDGKVIPLLFGLELSDLSGPLSQFQAKKVDQGGLMEAVQAINSVAENKTSDDIITRSVPAMWATLETAINAIPDKQVTEKHMRPQHEILEELVRARLKSYSSITISSQPACENADVGDCCPCC